jgi:hypothetical protein
MTITSTNVNPKNDSKYARHRSIRSGNRNKLRSVVDGLKATSGVTVHEYCGPAGNILSGIIRDFQARWNVRLGVNRRIGAVLGYWAPRGQVSERLRGAVPPSLRGDLDLIWLDFNTVLGRRLGLSDGAGSGSTESQERYLEGMESLIVFAPGRSSFDLIVSKYGYANNLKRDHHFYHWQARSELTQDQVHVDDLVLEL